MEAWRQWLTRLERKTLSSKTRKNSQCASSLASVGNFSEVAIWQLRQRSIRRIKFHIQHHALAGRHANGPPGFATFIPLSKPVRADMYQKTAIRRDEDRMVGTTRRRKPEALIVNWQEGYGHVWDDDSSSPVPQMNSNQASSWRQGKVVL
jgi:hypothetical protein